MRIVSIGRDRRECRKTRREQALTKYHRCGV